MLRGIMHGAFALALMSLLCRKQYTASAHSLGSAQIALGASVPSDYISACTTTAIPKPDLFGAEILSLTAAEVQNETISVTQTDSHFAVNLTGLNFCNVSITYTHPGYNDEIHVQVWLPLDSWNGRFLGTGGGGWAESEGYPALAYGVSQGYATVASDGGHSIYELTPESWALISLGNVNWYLLQDFASLALDDMTILGKAVTQSFYGKAAEYSYWNGCSTGGRQGLMQAQRYPTNYDGILAAAPAINWGSFIVAEYWGQLLMNHLGVYPPQCEFDALTAAAIEHCDALEGLKDGIIAAPGLCQFDPHTVVGTPYDCDGITTAISSAAATIAQAVWHGPDTKTGHNLWYGLTHDAPFSGLVNTTCSASGQNCTGSPFTISRDWIRFFLAKNSAFDVTKMTYAQYDRFFHLASQEYDSIIGTNDPDLSAFRDAGGKMITWHGLADQLIFPNGTVRYYREVLALDPQAQDYYRFFEAPGVGHCAGGIGPFPGEAFESLVRWVEDGVAPATLNGTSLPVNGTVRSQPLCAYPLVSAYKGSNPMLASSFECADGFSP